MAARKKKSASNRARNAIDDGLRDLEKRLPKNLRSSVKDLRSNIKALQRQAERLRDERDARWQKLERQVRGDIAKLLRRLEKAVAPSTRKKTSSKKKTTRRKAARKPARRKTARKKTTRKKTTRKKAARKKTARR